MEGAAKKRKPRSTKATPAPTIAKQEDNVYVKLDIKCATYSENAILDERRLMYDPTIHDPHPHDPHAGSFGAPANLLGGSPTEGRIFCYNEFDGSTPPEEPITAEEPKRSGGGQILSGFNLSAWPERTQVRCWWCCTEFDNAPIGAPLRYHEETDSFEVIGCFCSFPCASAYMRSDQKKTLNDKLYLLHMLWQRATPGDGTTPAKDVLLPAPPREMLEMFGGPLSEEAFHSASGHGRHFRLNMAPQLVPVEMIGEDMTQGRRGGLLHALKQANASPTEKVKTSSIDQLITSNISNSNTK